MAEQKEESVPTMDVIEQQGREEYFLSYEDLTVHELMLKDAPRVDFYKSVLEKLGNEGNLQNKVVLDCGAGTGILSLLAARYGAKKVIAVEASSVALFTKQIVVQNGFSSVIEVIQSRVEDLKNVKADIIISEWMGFYLLHEGMAHSVIWARDHLLSPNGLMIPSSAELFCCPVELAKYRQEHIDFWKNVYDGFDMSAIIPYALQATSSSPSSLVQSIEKNCLLSSNPQTVCQIDMTKVTSAELLAFSKTMEFKIERNGLLHAFALWFSVGFDQFELNTSPNNQMTHWKQTVIHIPSENGVNLNENDTVSCTISLSEDIENFHHYSIDLEDLLFTHN